MASLRGAQRRSNPVCGKFSAPCFVRVARAGLLRFARHDVVAVKPGPIQQWPILEIENLKQVLVRLDFNVRLELADVTQFRIFQRRLLHV
jgi:hypothetical protein